MTILFVGHHSPGRKQINDTTLVYSAAGDLVQENIFRNLLKINSDSKFYTMQPCQAWPKGPLVISKVNKLNGTFSGNITLPLLRHIFFSINLACQIIKLKPSEVICYNSYFFENATVVSLSKIFKFKTAIILQDIRVGGNFPKHQQLSDVIANKLVKFFDISVVVSKCMQSYLNLTSSSSSKHRSIVFPGGVSDFGEKAFSFNGPLHDYAVFAGALEKHNGIDKLITTWINDQIRVDLHIFGSGKLTKFVSEMADIHSNIYYHGFASQEVIFEWQVKAKFNFCFRFSEGIKQEFFFPSKFFNSVMCPGLLIFNDFSNVPDELKLTEGYIGNDFSKIKKIVENFNSINYSNDARNLISAKYSWQKLLSKLVCE
ncbi:hypothetical protein [Shewanella chilikensis]|uniref:hypothetical protein n=1 Tax=Shewanella chilikensis TaxID=558541 RepID=UPI00399BBFCE